MFRRFLVAVLVTLTLPVGAVVTEGPAAAAVGRPMLHQGQRGPAVTALQQRLTTLGYIDVGRVDGVFGPATWHAVVAFQKVQRIARDGVVGPVTWARLDSPLRPAPRYRLSGSSVEVDLARQVVYYARAGAIRAIADSSTGSGQWYWQDGAWHRAVTPTGRFRIYARYGGWRHSPLGWLYRPHFFYAGYALHGSTSVPTYPASHGCVRVTVPTMDRLAPMLWIGMPLAVYAR